MVSGQSIISGLFYLFDSVSVFTMRGYALAIHKAIYQLGLEDRNRGVK